MIFVTFSLPWRKPPFLLRVRVQDYLLQKKKKKKHLSSPYKMKLEITLVMCTNPVHWRTFVTIFQSQFSTLNASVSFPKAYSCSADRGRKASARCADFLLNHDQWKLQKSLLLQQLCQVCFHKSPYICTGPTGNSHSLKEPKVHL